MDRRRILQGRILFVTISRLAEPASVVNTGTVGQARRSAQMGADMKKFDIILWDVDQTLLDFGRSQRDALAGSLERYGRRMDEEILALYVAINDDYWKRHERGEVTKKELLTGRFSTLFSRMGITDIPVDAFAALYQKALGEVWYFRDEADELCQELKGEGIRQYAVTNGVSSTQRSKLRLSGLDRILDGIFVSEEMGEPKPSLLYFEKCFQQIPDFSRERTILVGDSLTSDIQGANNAEVCCCWYNPEKKKNDTRLRIDYEIRNLWELKDIL